TQQIDTVEQNHHHLIAEGKFFVSDQAEGCFQFMRQVRYLQVAYSLSVRFQVMKQTEYLRQDTIILRVSFQIAYVPVKSIVILQRFSNKYLFIFLFSRFHVSCQLY